MSNLAHRWSHCGPTITHSTFWIWFNRDRPRCVYCFQCVWGTICIVICQHTLQAVSEYSRKQRQPRSFMWPQGADVSFFHAKKNPPQHDAKVALTWRFPAVQVHFIKWDAREHFQWRIEEGLDKMLQRYRERHKGRVERDRFATLILSTHRALLSCVSVFV